jgi:hypothetical protein
MLITKCSRFKLYIDGKLIFDDYVNQILDRDIVKRIVMSFVDSLSEKYFPNQSIATINSKVKKVFNNTLNKSFDKIYVSALIDGHKIYCTNELEFDEVYPNNDSYPEIKSLFDTNFQESLIKTNKKKRKKTY